MCHSLADCSDFHTYRGYRAKETARLQDFEAQKREEDAKAAWEKERDELAAEQAARAAKRAEKRNKKKAKRKANAQAGKRKAQKTSDVGEEDEDDEGQVGDDDEEPGEVADA